MLICITKHCVQQVSKKHRNVETELGHLKLRLKCKTVSKSGSQRYVVMTINWRKRNCTNILRRTKFGS